MVASKINILYHVIAFCLLFILGRYLHNSQYFVSSSIMMNQNALCLKYVIEALFIWYGYSPNECNIFDFEDSKENLIEIHMPVKFAITFSMTIQMFFIWYNFNYFLNYFMFYFLLSYLVYIISFILEPEVGELFQPIRKFLYILAGLINFLLTKYHKHNIRFPNFFLYNPVLSDSFEITSDIFSCYWFYSRL